MGCFFVSKNNYAVNLLSQHSHIFSCPVCRYELFVDERSLICPHGHRFDLSKHGYVHLCLQAAGTKYDKSMFAARRMLSQTGLFEPLAEAIATRIVKDLEPRAEHDTLKILDAGCGEGWHLERIHSLVRQNAAQPTLGIGIDLAKEGVTSAAKSYKELLWCVGDLANPPLVSQQFNVILNILSPANYDAFHRLLCEGGIVIKVIPDRYYLRELREALWEGRQRSFSNDRTMKLFKEHFEHIEAQRVRYTYPLGPGQVQSLLAMTPLAWRTEDSKLKHFVAHPPTEITVDLAVMIGSKR